MAGTKARTHTGLTTLVLPYATENKIHQNATTTILESLEAKVSSLERSLEKGLKLLESKNFKPRYNDEQNARGAHSRQRNF